ncbi:MAG: hypothetical protein RLW62_24340 [Gammaproteobacteria bacterium]
MTAEKSARAQWCLVGNIVKARPGSTQRTFKGFAPGAKVYCLPAARGDGYEQMSAIGHHQQANRMTSMVVSGDRIENWRASAVYSAEVLRLLDRTARESGRRLWASRQEVEAYIEAIRSHLAARAERSASPLGGT